VQDDDAKVLFGGAHFVVRDCACTWTVSEHSRDVRAYLQPHLYDAAAGSLERLSPVLRAHVARLPTRHLGRHQ